MGSGMVPLLAAHGDDTVGALISTTGDTFFLHLFWRGFCDEGPEWICSIRYTPAWVPGTCAAGRILEGSAMNQSRASGCSWPISDGRLFELRASKRPVRMRSWTSAMSRRIRLTEYPASAITGSSWCAQNFPQWAALDDRFTAVNLSSSLARPGQNPPVAGDRLHQKSRTSEWPRKTSGTLALQLQLVPRPPGLSPRRFDWRIDKLAERAALR